MDYHQGKLNVALSAREAEVLTLLAKGLTNKEIAGRIRVSPSTVKRHVENILRKLQLKNRVEAAVYAVTKVALES
ncbi:MAG: LuxR C-terminal-related transcriptional regulator [Deltaproteobacteria bacterium]|nr:LuxR C-terminal-related transcriptional regulator [Deltaproteobacteria bacterium]MDZ4344874.1 LuxR C-terminal-related transcriptional regulator [Candidatus Binatia bacterium]